MNFSDIAILSIKGSDYRCITSRIRRKEVINLTQNIDLTKKSRTLLSRTKPGKEILTFQNIEIEKT